MPRKKPIRKTLKIFLLAAIIVLASALAIAQKPGGPVAICIDCAPGHIGGGCTYTDENTGQIVQPEQCVPYNTTKTIVQCQEDRGSGICILLYAPVCGNDARTYSNSCFACSNPHVAFYIEGTCEEVIGE